jgi:hypothetical protein
VLSPARGALARAGTMLTRAASPGASADSAGRQAPQPVSPCKHDSSHGTRGIVLHSAPWIMLCCMLSTHTSGRSFASTAHVPALTAHTTQHNTAVAGSGASVPTLASCTAPRCVQCATDTGVISQVRSNERVVAQRVEMGCTTAEYGTQATLP